MFLWKAAHAIHPRLRSPNTLFRFWILNAKYEENTNLNTIQRAPEMLPKLIPEPTKKRSRKKAGKKTPQRANKYQKDVPIGARTGGELTEKELLFSTGGPRLA